VYGGKGEQLGLYENHRWTEPPVELLQDALARGIRTSGHFRAVTTLRSDSSVDFSLTGHLYAFREVSTGGVVARLNFDVELNDLKLAKSSGITPITTTSPPLVKRLPTWPPP